LNKSKKETNLARFWGNKTKKRDANGASLQMIETAADSVNGPIYPDAGQTRIEVSASVPTPPGEASQLKPDAAM
jgi:hypothetical protein